MTKKERLTNLLTEGYDFFNKGLTSEDKKFIAWHNSVMRFLEVVYGKESTIFKQVEGVWFVPQVIGIGNDEYYDEEYKRCFNAGMDETLENLKRIIEEFDDLETADSKSNSVKSQSEKQPSIKLEIANNISNSNTNSNTNNISVKSYIEVKEEIESNTYLDEKSITELLEKLDEIKELENSKENRTKKWNSAKKILLYVLDKGVDIATAFIPLILQAISK